MRKKKRKNFKNIYALVVDGETEIRYFNQMNYHEPAIGFRLEPQLPDTGRSLKEQFDKVRELVNKKYARIFWIIDLDHILSISQKTKKGDKSAIQELREYILKLGGRKYGNKVVVIINNPCTEYWFLLHFEDTKKYFRECEKVIKQLSKHMPNYNKSAKYQKDIYMRLKPHLHEAVNRSKRLRRGDLMEPDKAICEMYLFFEEEGIRGVFRQ